MKISVKIKILFITTGVVVASLLIAGTYAYQTLKKSLELQAVEDFSVLVAQNQLSLTYLIDDMRNLSIGILISEELQNTITLDNSGSDQQQIREIFALRGSLKNFIGLRNYLYDIGVVTKEGNAYWASLPPDNPFDSPISSAWYNDFLKGGKTNGFTKPYENIMRDKMTKVISYISSIRTTDDPAVVVGSLIITVRTDMFLSLHENLKNYSDEFAILDENNHIIYGYLSEKNRRQIASELTIRNNSGNYKGVVPTAGGYSTFNTSLYTGWNIVSFVSNQRILDKIMPFLFWFMVFAILSIILICALLWPILTRLMRPFSTLVTAFRDVGKGNFNTSVAIHTWDEFGELAEGFNDMTQKLTHNIDNLLRNENEKKIMEMELLQAQLNPHFIYNTLDSIRFLIEMNRNNDASAMLMAFVAILHNSIAFDLENTMALMSEELALVMDYFLILKLRFGENIVFEYTMDPDLMGAALPKNILQPLIENSIIHGYNPERGILSIRLEAKRKTDRCFITVVDNGQGMSEDKAGEALSGKRVKKDSSMRSIGIHHIQHILALVYGNDAALKITSTVGKGTLVHISLPYRGYSTE